MAFSNHLLRALSPADLALLMEGAERVSFSARETIIRPAEPVRWMYFIESGILTMSTGWDRVDCADVGLIGREGASGLPMVFAGAESPFHVASLMSGYAHRVEAAHVRDVCRRSDTLGMVLHRYAQITLTMTAETARTNTRNTVEQRLARWLLMIHDRSDEDELRITHDALASALLVRRPGVTVATHFLEGDHSIRAVRGKITVLNRQSLEASACGGYGLPEAEYRRLIPRYDASVTEADAAKINDRNFLRKTCELSASQAS